MKKKILTIIHKIILYLLNNILNKIPSHNLRIFWYRIAWVQIGKRSTISLGVKVRYPWKISIWDNTIIGTDCFLDWARNLNIWNNTNISWWTSIFTLGHDIDCPFFSAKWAKVTIDDHVAIFSNSIILPGVYIAKWTAIWAWSVVTKDTLEWSFYCWNPAWYKRKRKITKLETKHNYRPFLH